MRSTPKSSPPIRRPTWPSKPSASSRTASQPFLSEGNMKTTRKLHELGQRLWLDNITRGLLTSGTLLRYISEFSVTGLTSNPTIFDKAIGEGGSYDAAIRRKTAEGKSGEALFFELALEDLTQAADLFRPDHDATGGLASSVSPVISTPREHDTDGSLHAADA